MVRLARFRERAACLDVGQRFLYGTHYSTPAFVAYFLLRTAPELTLHLHGGRFDEPDRAFASVASAWASACSSTTDVKELIPQFYHPPSAGFLVNGRGLELGTRQDGTPIGDVTLPPWAANPADFVNKCRAALESEYCSRALHLWIDLIFGCKQRGAAAEAADNLFCPATYEADYASATSPDERHALEAQVRCRHRAVRPSPPPRCVHRAPPAPPAAWPPPGHPRGTSCTCDWRGTARSAWRRGAGGRVRHDAAAAL